MKYYMTPSEVTQTVTLLGNLITEYLMGEETLISVPDTFKSEAKNRHDNVSKALLILDILKDQWPKLPNDAQQKLTGVILNRLINFSHDSQTRADPTTPPRVKFLKQMLSEFDLKYEVKSNAPFSTFDKPIIDYLSEFKKIKHEDAQLANKLLQLKYNVSEIINNYLETGAIHSRELTAKRIFSIQTNDYKIYLSILNAELDALYRDDPKSKLYNHLNQMLDAIHLRESNIKKSKEPNNKFKDESDLKKQIARILLDYAVSRENITKHPVVLISNLFASDDKENHDAISRRGKIVNIGKLAHDILKCNSQQEFQQFHTKISSLLHNMQKSHSESLPIINKVVELLEKNQKLYQKVDEIPPVIAPKSGV